MSADLDPLILDFLEWLAPNPRRYAEVMEAWRTSCPRLTVFEDSIDRGFVVRADANGKGRMIAITRAGRDFLAENRRMAPSGIRAAPNQEENSEERRR
ncbi:MAG: hypothetical protein QOF41_2786 [Methylobacteriaceae bacterium]|nr:hypothetical protein [Methylobacteriaceae bacterium]